MSVRRQQPMDRSPRPPGPGADLLGLAIDALATYRLTRLATADVISEPLRRTLVGRSLGEPLGPLAESGSTAQQVVDQLPDPPKAARLVTCRWCAGMWIAGGVVAARRAAPTLWDPLARALALSATAVLASRLED